MNDETAITKWSHRASFLQCIKQHLFLMCRLSGNSLPVDEQFTVVPFQPIDKMEIPEPLLVRFPPIILRKVLCDIQFIWFELEKPCERIICADTKYEMVAFHPLSLIFLFRNQPKSYTVITA